MDVSPQSTSFAANEVRGEHAGCDILPLYDGLDAAFVAHRLDRVPTSVVVSHTQRSGKTLSHLSP